MAIATVLLGAVAGASGCGGQTKAASVNTPDPEEPSRRRARRNAMNASVWRFVYCLEAGTAEGGLHNLLVEIANDQPFNKRIEIVDCNDVPVDTLGTGPVTIFGNRLPPGAQAPPIRKTTTGWTLDGNKTVATGDVLMMPYYRNPWSTRATTAGFYLAADPANLVARYRKEYGKDYDRMFWPNWAFELYRENGDRVYGAFIRGGWAFDPEEEVSLQSPDKPVFDEDGLTIFAYDGLVKQDEVAPVVTQLRLINEAVSGFMAGPPGTFPEVRLYPNLESINRRTGLMEPILYEPGEQLLHIVPSFLAENEVSLSFEAWRHFFVREELTPERERSPREAIAVAQRHISVAGLDKRETEAARLAATGLLTHARENSPSRYVEEARARVAARRIGPLSEEQLPQLMLNYLNGIRPKRTESTTKGRPEVPPVRKLPPPIQRLGGMTFAHEGYRGHNGYGGEKIKPSLDSLLRLNVNALAVVPYTFMRDPTKPTELPLSQGGGQENDAATIQSIRAAHERGMFTMLKPQIWVGGGHWPGDVDFATDEEWDTFFAGYTYWIIHYAVMAQRERVGALCLGTELVKTTLRHPDRWRELIRKVRLVYGGRLTYAANWGEEFEGFSFWKDLDVIGLNSYYPLSDKAEATDEELLAGARRWMQMAAAVSTQTGRPLWLTEVGFRSVDRAWVNPHADAGDRSFNGEAQARGYRALLAAAEETPALRGMFVWKWPSYLGRGDRWNHNTGFTPGGKPGALELARFYGGWER